MSAPALARLHLPPQNDSFRLVHPQAPAILSLPHLRGWLAAFPPVADLYRCSRCEGTSVLTCQACFGGFAAGKPCKTCHGEPYENCGDCEGVPIAVAIVLGVPLVARALHRRLTRQQNPTAVARVLRSGAIQIGRSRAMAPYSPIDGARHVVRFEQAYAHEQLPLRGLRYA